MKKPIGCLLIYYRIRRIVRFSLILIVCFSANSLAQTDSVKVPEHNWQYVFESDSSADIWDMYYRFINKKGHRRSDHAKPGLHSTIFPELAYAIQTGVAVGLNANLSFTSANPEQNISTIIFTPQYTQYHQIIVPVVLNLWTKDNRFNIVTDWRYYDYSADNFGLGSNSPANADDHLTYSYMRLQQAVLRQVAPNLSVGVGYALDYHWNIRDVNSTPQLNDDFERYGTMTKTVSSGPTFSVQYTNRRNPNNPQSGFFGSVVVRPNLRLLGSDQNWQSVIADFRKYVPLSSNGRHILAFWNMNWLSLGGQAPYLDLPSTGWDTYSNMGRGYVQGRYRGRNLVYLEAEYRAQLLPSGLLGAVLFTNMQTYSDYPNTNHFGRLLPGGGVGLRVKMNKHSNLNFAIDYGFGIGGAQGLFLNFGEVF
ncbi:BamA/TamA family outer membrane protein [Spirosoma pollinicola]|uniref:BamA/TamA family outer membrane protein n=1 Tax=Spirosoma pollinicola TaxID=2057025 RepID=UPI0012FD45FD|nr:BamA/TamA family outer membrane protein [Spirosoma pollinicola]